MTRAKFEAIDLSVFTLIATGVECLIIWAYSSFGKADGYIVSFAAVLGLIAIFRWNWLGVIVPIVAGGMSVLVSGRSDPGYILAMTAGYLALLVGLAFFKGRDKKELAKNLPYLFGYYFVSYLALEVGRAICQLIFLKDTSLLPSILYHYFVEDLLNILFGALIFFIAIKQKTIVYDMKLYLAEVAKTTEASRIRDSIEDYQSLESMAEKDDVSDIALLDGGMLTKQDLEKMESTYRQMTSTGNSKFLDERKAVELYKKDKRRDDNHSRDEKSKEVK